MARDTTSAIVGSRSCRVRSPENMFTLVSVKALDMILQPDCISFVEMLHGTAVEDLLYCPLSQRPIV